MFLFHEAGPGRQTRRCYCFNSDWPGCNARVGPVVGAILSLLGSIVREPSHYVKDN